MSVSTRDTLHLLLLTQTQNDAEQLISLIRNSGSATRAQTVTSHQQFEDSIRATRWDVIVADPELDGIDFSELINQVNRLNLDIPVILAPRKVDPMLHETALLRGGAGMVAFEESNTLVLMIQREVQQLRVRQDIRVLQIRLREAEKRCRLLLESSRDPIAYVHDGMHVYANQAYLEMFGYDSVEELEGMPVMDMVAAESQGDFKAFLKEYQGVVPEGRVLHLTGELPDGSHFPMQMSFSEAMYADETCTQLQIKREESTQVLEAELDELRIRDASTNLYNKSYFVERLTRAIDQAIIEKSYSTLMYISIDGFDNIKRTVGIQQSDEVIRAVAACLSEHAIQYDITARISDEAFAWMMPGRQPEEAQQRAQTLVDAVAGLLVDLEQQTIRPTISIGITLITDNSPAAAEALQQAHNAAEAVSEGDRTGNGIHLYMPEDEHQEQEIRKAEDELADAVRTNRLKLLFQPLINLRGEDAEHYEVLLRMPDRDGSEISAGDFLLSADISDELKRKVDRWVILHATKLLSVHQRKGNQTRIFINLTGASLRDDGLAGWVQVALKAAELKHDSVIFQMTEEDAVRHIAPAKRFCYQMHAVGIRTAVSRFGCELSPMDLLEKVDLDYVKIDGSFTQELENNSQSGKVLKQLLGDIHERGKKSIAPFVESASAVSSIWQYGVHFIQGYYVQGPQAGMTYDFSDEDAGG
ncbi:EAL domain-containing protein [Thalassolituus sp.]|uniref:EAL domain-containing protein n=1 Tax=Thalassolituus sp. TaxID=2030822 RepID=UPI003514C79B